MTSRAQLRQAVAALGQGRFEEAAALASELLVLQPDHAQARWLLAQALDQQGQVLGAIDQLRLLLRFRGDQLATIDQVAGYLLQRGHPLQPALAAYEQFLADRPDSATAAFNHAWYLARDGQFAAAADGYLRALELGADAPQEVHLNLANLWMDHLQDPARARQHLQQALAIAPQYAGAWFNLGNLSEQAGERAEAAACFEQCLAIEPNNETALARLADVHRFAVPDDPLLARLAAAAQTSRNADLHFALGRACEQLADFDRAWAHFSTANAIDREGMPPYDPQQAEAFARGVRERCDSGWFARSDGDSHRPVFICGMFRTGSTLLEQMLGAHPRFYAGGESEFFPRLVARELPRYPDGLEAIAPDQLLTWRQQHAAMVTQFAGSGRRLTDKRPDNFLYVGLIKSILPSAKFAVTQRDWRDVAISIFSTRLGPRQNYATRLEDIRHYLGLHETLVNHWASLLGSDLVRVRYEDLVSQPRPELERVLQALGEEWDDRCLAFDTLGNTVRTASAWQVRQPLHAQSIGRWGNYRRRFEEVFGADPDA
jgi:tetratricopeptide (TPR) repeat protein